MKMKTKNSYLKKKYNKDKRNWIKLLVQEEMVQRRLKGMGSWIRLIGRSLQMEESIQGLKWLIVILIRLQQRMWWQVLGVWLNRHQQRFLNQEIIQQRKVDHKLERTFIIEQIPKIIVTMEAPKMLKEMSVEISHQV